jgi:putative alpha-1,2-mannosidase
MKKFIRLNFGFIRPKKTVVGTALDPRENNNFTEGNAWQYTFVLQDIPGLRCLWRER